MNDAYFLRMERINTERNERRFYEMFIEPDFFDGQSLMVRWGRIGQPGNIRVEESGEIPDLLQAAHIIARKKSARGYCGVP